jgi:hypothetical protein|nr:MAG TPA: glycoside hydrolase family protein [Caudoviricetes sp.]
MKQLIHPNDPYQMNWIEGQVEWGTVKCPKGIEVTKDSKKEGDIIRETYTFTNTTGRDIFTSLEDIAIYTPFNDDYKDSETCMRRRCHAHLFCGGMVTYVMALRMGGKPPHLGLVLTKGCIGGYSVERDFEKMSNDRGDFLLHPSPVSLAPGESMVIEWVLFWHEGKEDFYRQVNMHHKRYLHVRAQRYVLFQGEKIHLEITPVFDWKAEDVQISRDGKELVFQMDNGTILVEEEPEKTGEYTYHICVGGIQTMCNILVQPPLLALSRARCQFIARNQQYHKKENHLDGALLIYDNEEKHMYYSPENDYNAARERIGMGILLAKHLQIEQDELLEDCLKKYISYIRREVFDGETGEVFNDYLRDNSYFRLYNYPWVSLFFLELYTLYGKKEYLTDACRALGAFYEQGGAKFYAIEVPVVRIIRELEREQMEEEKKQFLQYFRQHGDFMLEKGTNYPAHEVNYEQSIVAPAANTLLQTYQVTKDEKYLAGARQQMEVLELFNGLQPDYHLYEVAIRHWDGYWFGKTRLYGDTFPHYWSSLTGNAYADFGKITGGEAYQKRAEDSLRASLSLFYPDGSASCAFVYPVSVNGHKAYYADAYANDQDWALYFMLRYHNESDFDRETDCFR